VITIAPITIGQITEAKQLLSYVWSCTYSDHLSPEAIQKVTSIWHAPERLQKQIENPDVYFAGAMEDNKLVGIITAEKEDDQVLFITRLYVHPNHQRKGIGSKLYKAAVEHFIGIKRVKLDVDDVNHRALEFYKKLGFTEIERKEEELAGEKHTSIVMAKFI
jgi:diamine N-acetyltransferase